MMQLDNVRHRIIHDEKFPTPDDKYHACEQYGILQSLKNLRTFPWIDERVIDGRLELHGWYYDLTQGQLHVFEEDKKEFQRIL